MASSLLQIKSRIKSVKNTRKITKAMQLVAASKMRFFQGKAVNSRLYAWDMLGLLKNLFVEAAQSSFLEKRESGKVVFLLYTSDKGLCGALNTRILKALFQSRLWLDTPQDDRILLTIGKKSRDYARYNKIPIAKSFDGINERLTTTDALPVIDAVLEYWEKGDVKHVVMAAPHYKNSLVFYPQVKTFLPFSEEMIASHMNTAPDGGFDGGASGEGSFAEIDLGLEPDMLYEPDGDRFAEVLIEQIVTTLFIQSFFELKAAEYSSRMVAMQNATNAATDMADALGLQFNKARQAAITQEIAELVSGSMT